ncbi:hypothetical protein AYI70_g3286 [Smittium culicis]|uniref:Uncharacterized protein n=1 Tax=Smittium culicis TaxID=133412 RepID=A0A1R1Y4L9_9FUNG|nr:hypothetical protein AYI70_g3286 [Smittium culicis]
MVKKEFDIELSISKIHRCCFRFFYNLKRIRILPIRRNDEENLNAMEEYSKKYTDYTATYDEEEFFSSMRNFSGLRSTQDKIKKYIDLLHSK